MTSTVCGGATTACSYDADGRLSSAGSVSFHYNDLGLPYVKAGAGSVTKWTYSADGVRLSREATAGAGVRMDYVGDLVFRDGSLDRILIPGGRAMDMLFLYKVCFYATHLVQQNASQAGFAYKVGSLKSHLVQQNE